MINKDSETITLQVNKKLQEFDSILKSIIHTSLKHAGINEINEIFHIKENICSYDEVDNIGEYIFMKLKEYFISNAFMETIEYSLNAYGTDTAFAMSTILTEEELKYATAYLYTIHNKKDFNSKESYSYNLSNGQYSLIPLKDKLINEMKCFCNSISIFLKTDTICTKKDKGRNDIFIDFYNKASMPYNSFNFLIEKTPLKYKRFMFTSIRKIPYFHELSSFLFLDLFYDKYSSFKYAEAIIKPLIVNERPKKNKTNTLLESYNYEVEQTNKVLKRLSSYNKKRANLLRHYSNMIFCNDFFRSIDSQFVQLIYSNINFKKLYSYAKERYKALSENEKSKQMLTINDYNYLDSIIKVTILEFLMKFNLNLNFIDNYILKEVTYIDKTIITGKINIDKLLVFLYSLSIEVESTNLKLNFSDIYNISFEVTDYLDEILRKMNYRFSSLQKIDDKNKTIYTNYDLFAYLFLYRSRNYDS